MRAFNHSSSTMAPYASLIPELETAIRQGSDAKRATMAERITDLFIDAAERFDAVQIALFDEVLGRLIEEIEVKTLAEISRRMAPIEQAPIGVVRRLAGDDAIDVAGPMLRESSRLADSDLAAIASRRGPAHLLAISQRAKITAHITDILVVRGDNSVLQACAINRGAQFSSLGFGTLVRRATGDDGLTETVALRPDIPVEHLRGLVREATEIVRRRLLAATGPGVKTQVSAALAEVAAEVGANVADAYRDAQKAVLALVSEGALDESQLRAFATNGQLDETIATLSALSRVPIEVVERLMRADRLDGLLILARAIGIEWPTVRTIVVLRTGRTAGPTLDDLKSNFERLSRSSAERVARFWRNGKTAPAQQA
jgi:uncharacterized protein (DUF2336 family)